MLMSAKTAGPGHQAGSNAVPGSCASALISVEQADEMQQDSDKRIEKRMRDLTIDLTRDDGENCADKDAQTGEVSPAPPVLQVGVTNEGTAPEDEHPKDDEAMPASEDRSSMWSQQKKRKARQTEDAQEELCDKTEAEESSDSEQAADALQPIPEEIVDGGEDSE